MALLPALILGYYKIKRLSALSVNMQNVRASADMFASLRKEEGSEFSECRLGRSHVGVEISARARVAESYIYIYVLIYIFILVY